MPIVYDYIYEKLESKTEKVKMLCIFAGNYLEAMRWARSQFLSPEEWFFPTDTEDLLRRSNFHVLVVGSAGQNIPANYFEKVYSLAKERGRIGRI